jgi:prepilin signal peptidase PulO-like enzyme (type II secretory pathway)
MNRVWKAALVAPTLVLAHQLVFLVRYGSVYGEALAHTGHGPAWTGAVAIVALGTGLLLAGFLVGTIRVARELRRRQGAQRATRPARITDRAVGEAIVGGLRTGALLIAASLLGLTVQENLEHAAAGLPMPGIGILVSPAYPFAVAIVAGVALAVALVATVLTWRRRQLVARLSQLRDQAAWGRAPQAGRRPVAGQRPLRSGQVARQLGRRAPPLPLPA